MARVVLRLAHAESVSERVRVSGALFHADSVQGELRALLYASAQSWTELLGGRTLLRLADALAVAYAEVANSVDFRAEHDTLAQSYVQETCFAGAAADAQVIIFLGLEVACRAARAPETAVN